MTIERAIEILDPEHRERYDSLETVEEACRMGMRALEREKPVKTVVKDSAWYRNQYRDCGYCGELLSKRDRYCRHCGRAVDWGD